MRRWIGIVSAGLAMLLCICLILGMIHLVPIFDKEIFGESTIRFIAQLDVLMLLIAGGAFWSV